MKSFLKIGNVPVGHIQQTVWRHPELWEEDFLPLMAPMSGVVDLSCRELVLNVMRAANGHALRSYDIDRLAPGEWRSNVPPVGRETLFLVFLFTGPGNIFRCGEEEISPQTGDIWMVRKEFLEINNSSVDRLVLSIVVSVWE